MLMLLSLCCVEYLTLKLLSLSGGVTRTPNGDAVSVTVTVAQAEALLGTTYNVILVTHHSHQL